MRAALYFSCIICKYELCVKCYGNEFGRENIQKHKNELYFELKQKGIFIPPYRETPKCPVNHTLVNLKGKTYPEGKTHDCQSEGCKKKNIDKSKNFWNCLKCEYDICHECLIRD